MSLRVKVKGLREDLGINVAKGETRRGDSKEKKLKFNPEVIKNKIT